MKNTSKHDDNSVSVVGSGGNTDTVDVGAGDAAAVIERSENSEKAADNAPVKLYKRIIKTIPRRMMLNYFVYAAAILVMLWVALLFGLNWFYGAIVHDDVRNVGFTASAAFPKRGDDNSMFVMYRDRLSEIARANSAAIIVFEREGEDIRPIVIVDAIGQSVVTDAGNDVCIEIVKALDIDDALADRDKTGEANTDYGSFVYYASEHTVKTDGGAHTMYLVVFKSDVVFTKHTYKILTVLVVCTMVALVIAFVSAWFAARYQTKCLTDFTKKAKRVAEGEYDVKFSGYGYYEYDTLATALNSATERLKSSEQLQRDFIANVSHDIRTPITIIRAYAEMIRDLPQDEQKRKKTAETIIAEADRLTTLTNDVMSYSRLSSGTTEFEFENCDISAMAVSVLHRFDYFKERDGIVFETDIDKGLTVNCDKKHIEQVLYNFIGNAFNYCGDDKTIILRVKNVDGVARVEVGDHGKGIAESELDAVWDRYYRTAHAKRSAVGSGLGLSICNNILKAHGVKYGVSSEVGKGSTFWFEFDIVKK